MSVSMLRSAAVMRFSSLVMRRREELYAVADGNFEMGRVEEWQVVLGMGDGTRLLPHWSDSNGGTEAAGQNAYWQDA